MLLNQQPEDSVVKYDGIAGLFVMQPFFCINQQRHQHLSAHFMVLIYLNINIFQFLYFEKNVFFI